MQRKDDPRYIDAWHLVRQAGDEASPTVRRHVTDCCISAGRMVKREPAYHVKRVEKV